jgi:hypothetical protein
METEKNILLISKKDLEEEEKASYNELVTQTEWVFKHPILREWVKVAPSINSIDKWIFCQFSDFEHKLDLIKIMRRAVKVWQKTKGENRKNLLETPQNWRLSDIFVFSSDETSLKAEERSKSNLHFAWSMKFLPDSAKAIRCNKWPLFLREFGYKFSPHGTLRTSVDSLPIDANQFWKIKKIDEEFWENKTAESFKGNPSDLIDLVYQIKFHQKALGDRKKIVWADILLEKFGITTQIVQVEPQDGKSYPRFYKTVFFRDKLYDSPNHSIKIWWPIDCFHSNKKGWLQFSKSVKLREQMKTILNLDYSFNDSFKLIPDPEHILYNPHSHIQMQISGTQQSLLFQKNYPVPKKEDFLEAMEILFENFVEAWEFSIREPNVSLHSILGESILKDSPDSLLQLFTG